MKVKREIIDAAILKLVSQITDTMPNTMYQFLFGGATAMATLASRDKIDQMIRFAQDENGLVDVGMIEGVIDSAFNASGNKVQIELFNNPGLVSMFVKPLTVTITRDDIRKLLNDIRQNSVSNEISLPKNLLSSYGNM